MFIPFKDDNPLVIVRFQYVTVALLIVNTFVFMFLQGGISGQVSEAGVLSFGVVPAVLFGFADLHPDLVVLPAEFSLLTYMFLHGGWLHLISNMLFLWVFADNVEDQLGHVRFLLFYLLCGIGSGFVHAIAIASSQNPLIGASGAIAGVVGAYFVMFPNRKIWVLLFFGIPMRIPAILVLGLWILSQVLSYSVGQYGDTGVAWLAHISGFLLGVVLVFILRPRPPGIAIGTP